EPAFALQASDFANYDPSKVMTSVEMTEARPPVQRWPTESDLSAIRATPYNEAIVPAQRWPATALLSSGTFAVSSDTASSAPTGPNNASAGFVSPPGQAP